MSKRTGNRDGRAAKKRRARHRMRMERPNPEAYKYHWPASWTVFRAVDWGLRDETTEVTWEYNDADGRYRVERVKPL